MHWGPLAAYFFGGMFLTNAVPHLVSGVLGRAFQTPFAKPPGKGLSSSTVNVLWGWGNLAVGYALCRMGHFDLRSVADAGSIGAGVLLMGVMLARTFGKLHGGQPPEEN